MRALLLVLLLSTPAFAAAKPRVVVDAPAPLKALLTSALKKKFTPVPSKKPLADEPSASQVKQATREAGAIALVIARNNGGTWLVMVLNGADGSPLEQFRFNAPARKPLKALPKGTDVRLAQSLADARAPAKEEVKKEEPVGKDEPTKTEETAKKEEVAETRPSKKGDKKDKKTQVKDPTPPPVAPAPTPVPEAKKEEPVAEPSGEDKPVAIRAAIGGRVFSRRFFYNRDLFNSLSKYSLNAGPALVADVDWFPGAHVTSGPASRVGLSLGLNYTFGISSVVINPDKSKTSFATSSVRFRVGLVGRFDVGPIELLPTFGWMLQTYSIAASGGAARPNIPDVSYSDLRFGLGTRIKLIGPLLLTAGFAYDLPLSLGEISSSTYFPHAKAGGLDANLGLAVAIGSHLEVRGGVDYIRYWYSLNPAVGDPGVANNYVAGGALDDYRGINLTLAFAL